MTSCWTDVTSASPTLFGWNLTVVKPVDFHEFANAIKELGVFWAVINQPPPGSIRRGPLP